MTQLKPVLCFDSNINKKVYKCESFACFFYVKILPASFISNFAIAVQ